MWDVLITISIDLNKKNNKEVDKTWDPLITFGIGPNRKNKN